MRAGNPGFVLAAYTVLLLSSRTATAVDGVIEVNHTVALAGGVNGSPVNDPPGYPIVITEPGSYRLTGNLAPLLVTGVRVDSANVSIDLNGFAVVGSYVAGNPCALVPVGFGVYSTQPGVVVRDGQVSNMASQGVSLDGRGSRIERVVARDNCSTGLWVGESGLVVDGQAIGNRGHGIVANDGGAVIHGITRSNTLSGIFGFDNVRIADSTAIGNGEAGVFVSGSGGVVSQCTANQNGSNGIQAVGNLVQGCYARNNAVGGINASYVEDCVTANNPSFGIAAASYLGCSISNLVRICP